MSEVLSRCAFPRHPSLHLLYALLHGLQLLLCVLLRGLLLLLQCVLAAVHLLAESCGAAVCVLPQAVELAVGRLVLLLGLQLQRGELLLRRLCLARLLLRLTDGGILLVVHVADGGNEFRHHLVRLLLLLCLLQLLLCGCGLCHGVRLGGEG